jgi:hypothetical protein
VEMKRCSSCQAGRKRSDLPSSLGFFCAAISNERMFFRDVSLVEWWTSCALCHELVAGWRKNRGTQR